MLLTPMGSWPGQLPNNIMYILLLLLLLLLPPSPLPPLYLPPLLPPLLLRLRRYAATGPRVLPKLQSVP
jgi:hypothetical protein